MFDDVWYVVGGVEVLVGVYLVCVVGVIGDLLV